MVVPGQGKPSLVSKLTIYGLHDRSDVEVEFLDSISIFMGPNGIGKSTVLSIFVQLLSCQWSKLAKQAFWSAKIDFPSGEAVTVTRSECLDFTSGEMPSRSQQIAMALAEADALDGFIEGRALDDDELQRIGVGSSIQERELRMFRLSLLQYSQSLKGLASLVTSAKVIKRSFDGSIIYLPTYRRIEQDITELFSMPPAAMRRVQAGVQDALGTALLNSIEIVRFGMEDVERLLRDYTSSIKEYSRQQVNSLSTKYLTAALKNRQHFERDFFNSLSDGRIKDVLARVDEQELSGPQRKELTELIKSLRKREGFGRLTRSQEHIGGYFPMLAETHDRISKREEPLQLLARTLNKYIGPSKRAAYDPIRYEFTIRVGEMAVPLAGLSSGEKQLISLFSTLILNEKTDLFVVIDEPELSLSVLWQEHLLEDIISVENCANVVAVTHSPFIYGERMAIFTRDLADFTSSSAAGL